MIKKEDTFVHREQGKKWKLPVLLNDGDGLLSKLRTYKVLGYRKPKKGEFYLSGAICEAWKTPSDLSDRFLVIEFDEVEYVQRTIWVPKT